MKLYNKKTGKVLILLDEWEVDPDEPLIKDEKVRKVLKEWADVNNISQVIYDTYRNAFRCEGLFIVFDYDFNKHDCLEGIKSYTIEELCGKEENETTL